MIQWLFKQRHYLVSVAALSTILGLWFATGIGVDAGFEKGLPPNHPFMKTFKTYRKDFGGADRIIVAITPKEGDIFTPKFMKILHEATEEAFYIEGVNRAQILSLFTPNARFLEIVDGGFAGGNIVPPNFDYSEEMVAQVRRNVVKSSYIGRLVSNDFKSTVISIQLIENADQLKIAAQLEEKLRGRFEDEHTTVQIIGFAKAMGEIADGARGVLMLLSLTVILVALLVNFFLGSWRLTILAVGCSMTAVVWNIATIALLGFGFDLMSILVPFLIFAIGVSHALQILNRVNIELEHGRSSLKAGMNACRILVKPGLVALASDTLGFATIYLIDIPSIQSLAIMASLGVLYLIFCNLLLLPLLVSYLTFSQVRINKLCKHRVRQGMLWDKLAQFTSKKASIVGLSGTLILFLGSAWISQDLQIGDLHEGVPELRSESRYNVDTKFIVENYGVGVDVLTVFMAASENACIDYDVVKYIDDFEWYVSNNPNVHSTLSMPNLMKSISAGWAEGYPKWGELSRNSHVLVQAASPISSVSGLRNPNCSVMPVLIFLKDHKAGSINSVIQTIDEYLAENSVDYVNVELASGNAGVMAAVNQTIEESQYRMLAWIYGLVTLLCLALFRSIRATVCVMAPLVVVSTVAYAMMTILQIGLKPSSLPIAALGVGIGVDYGIYIFSQLHTRLKAGDKLVDGYRQTLELNGSAVMVTGLTLAISVGTWTFSDLQFQADMGILFSTMLILNMIGAMHVGPALSYWLYPSCQKGAPTLKPPEE